MVNTSVIVNSKTGCKKYQHKVDFVSEKFLVFGFPIKNQELNKKQITFVRISQRLGLQRNMVVLVHNVFKKDVSKSGNELH